MINYIQLLYDINSKYLHCLRQYDNYNLLIYTFFIFKFVKTALQVVDISHDNTDNYWVIAGTYCTTASKYFIISPSSTSWLKLYLFIPTLYYKFYLVFFFYPKSYSYTNIAISTIKFTYFSLYNVFLKIFWDQNILYSNNFLF